MYDSGHGDDRVDRGTEGGVSKQQSTNLACIAAPKDKSKAGGATTTTTNESGGKNWGNDQVNEGARSGQGATMTTTTTKEMEVVIVAGV